MSIDTLRLYVDRKLISLDLGQLEMIQIWLDKYWSAKV